MLLLQTINNFNNILKAQAIEETRKKYNKSVNIVENVVSWYTFSIVFWLTFMEKS